MEITNAFSPSEIGRNIKKARLNSGMSVETLAKKIGKGRATIYRYENGEIENAPATVLIPIANALNVSVEYLLGIENDTLSLNTKNNAIKELSEMNEIVEQNEKNRLNIIKYNKDFANVLNRLEANGYDKNEIRSVVDEYNKTIAPLYRQLIAIYDEQKKKSEVLQNAILMFGDELLTDLDSQEIEEIKNYIKYIKSKRKD